jgi:membrane-bound lytic murein transglycosylase MltF
MRTLLGVMTLAGLLGACSSPREAAPANATPEAPPAISVRSIPVVSGRKADDLSRIGRTAKGDLDAIIERGYLRVLAARSRTEFERKDGEISGGAVDAGAALETVINQRAKVSVVFIETPENALISDLLAGRGDVAANVLLTFERDEQVAFAKPVRSGIRELVVVGSNEPHVVSLEDVGGRSIHVRAASDHHASLLRLNDQLKKIARPPARIILAPPRQTDEDLLDQVNTGRIPATISYDYVYDICCGRLPGLKTNRDVAVSQDGVLAWVTRKDAPKLLALLNEFFSTHALMRGGS